MTCSRRSRARTPWSSRMSAGATPTSTLPTTARLERAVEVHSTWGTFEWLLHDAFEKGFRVGVVCHSDDHKGRPGRDAARRFDLRRDRRADLLPDAGAYARRAVRGAARAPALRHDRHAALARSRGTFDAPVTRFSDDPQLGPAQEEQVRAKPMMGDIIRPGTRADAAAAPKSSAPRRSSASTCCTARASPRPFRPYAAADLGRRVRVLWQGAEYRGRGRETHWQGKLTIERQPHRAFCAGQLPQSRSGRCGRRRPARARLEFGDDRQHGRHRPLARRARARNASDRNQFVSGDGRSGDARRRRSRSTAAGSAAS